jgi:hypothetical protein
MFSDFVHSRPLLRAFLACVLMAGLLGTAAATHSGMTQAVAMAEVDVTSGDIDIADDNVASMEDNCVDDTLVVPAAMVVPGALHPVSQPMSVQPSPACWHANFELRPPIA